MRTLKRLGAALALMLCLVPANVHAQLPPSSPPTNALATFSFSDTNAWTDDAGTSPISFTNLLGGFYGDGTSLMVDSNSPSWLQFGGFNSDGSTNLSVGPSGSVFFWYSPDWASATTNNNGAGPGLFARLLEVGAYTTNASYGWFSLFLVLLSTLRSSSQVTGFRRINRVILLFCFLRFCFLKFMNNETRTPQLQLLASGTKIKIAITAQIIFGNFRCNTRSTPDYHRSTTPPDPNSISRRFELRSAIATIMSGAIQRCILFRLNAAVGYYILALFLLPCGNILAGSSNDSKLENSIAGIWTYDTNSTQCTIVLDSSGFFKTTATNAAKQFSYEGKWQVRNGILITTLTNTSEPKYEPVGHIERFKILRLDESELVYKSESEGQIISLKRQSE